MRAAAAGLLDAHAAPSTRRRPQRRAAVRGAVGRRARAASDRGRRAAAAFARRDARGRGRAVPQSRRRGSDRGRRAALARPARARAIVEGGSTITQQVAKLLLDAAGGRHRARVGREGREAVVALRLEHRLTKNEILALYLNLAPYGNQIDGAARASAAYFGRDASSLTPAEAAFLAGAAAAADAASTRGATRGRPAAPARGSSRTMARAAGYRRRGGGRAPRANSIALDQRAARARSAPHFVERVLAAPIATPTTARIETTLDAGLQRTVGGIIARAIARRSTSTTRPTSRSPCSTTARANGSRGRDRATTSTQRHGGAIDGVDRRRGSPDRR